MKISKILLAFAVTANLFAAVAFAEPANTKPSSPAIEQKNSDKTSEKGFKCQHKHMKEEMLNDPVKALESKKKDVLELEKEGKISKEEADKITRKIDERIKDIQEFNKLTIEQKREKLISKYKTRMALKVKEGKLTQEKADERIADFTREIQNWDGNGLPSLFHNKHMMN
ncbi:MAG: hypothetical protein BWY74_00670 [Firmicutes bacterium ADurb.Bin419]|nr:MAG: hypothetical protein BWY74_00670 [Firmicutes bacterium ADurb.Bin419]